MAGVGPSGSPRNDVRSPSPTETVFEFAVDIDEHAPVGGVRQFFTEIKNLFRTKPRDTSQRLHGFTLSGVDSEIMKKTDKLIKETKFDEAISLIEDYPPTQHQQLLLSECYLQLGRMRDVTRSIITLENLLMANSSKDKIIKLIDEYISTESFIRSLILLSCLSKMYKLESDPNQLVEGIRYCARRCAWEVILKMLRREGQLWVIATDLGLEIMNDMLTQLRSVSGADSDLKSKRESQCLNDIGCCYFELKDYYKSIELRQIGIDVMKKEFGANAPTYQVFGAFMNNIGFAHSKLGNYSDAYAFYLQAVEIYDVVEDWNNDDIKHEIITETKSNLVRVEKQMSNDDGDETIIDDI